MSEHASPTLIRRPGEIFDPVARALDWIGDKWALVLIRHLLRGPRGFQELRQRTGITQRVLSNRLRQLTAAGFVGTAETEGGRQAYAATDRARELEPIIAALARWYVHHAVEELDLDIQQFTETSAISILESLPFLLREELAADADVVFELRLTGDGGGVWSIHIHQGQCRVESGFATGADVRYTADARIWCAVALGLLDARDAAKRGLLQKEGGREAMDPFFHQLARPMAPSTLPETSGGIRE
ncbi:MAG: winged helix DNA-binding protein [bacterium]|nr:winged helix DNA-binding protein [bacterium]MCP5068112.1 winged helix DNA-binding protein [bacterium]